MPPADDDYDAPAPKQEKGNAGGLALSIVGLVLGTCALLFSFIPCLGYYAIFPGVLAIILSGIGVFISTKAKALPIVAVVVSVLATGIAYWQGTRIDKVEDGVKQIGKDAQKLGNQAVDEMKRQQDEAFKKMKGGN